MTATAPLTVTAADKPANPEPRAVFFDGPHSKPDPKGEKDEQPFWTVYVGRDWGDPVKTVYQVNTFSRAASLAQAMAADRNLELVNDAQEA